MTEIVLAHDEKHVRGHPFSVWPNASPKNTPGLSSDPFRGWVVRVTAQHHQLSFFADDWFSIEPDCNRNLNYDIDMTMARLSYL